MKITNKPIYKVLFVALSLNLLSCSDSFLEISDTESISPGNFPKSLSDLELILSSVYAVQHEVGFMGQYYPSASIYCLDHTIDLQWRQDEKWVGICIGSSPVGYGKTTTEWRDINRGIYFANTALEAVSDFRSIAKIEQKQAIDHIEGQILFLRGFYMWHLQVLYGQPDLDGLGIPVVKSVPKTLESMSVPRESTKDSYQAMIGDFKKAADLLKGQTDNHKATEWSAKAALAKTYLFAEKPDSAKIYLEDCIHNSGKSLVSFSFYKNMYNGDIQYEYNSESFYEVGNLAEPDKPASWPMGSSIPNTGSENSLLFTPFYVNSEGERREMGYSNEYMHDRNLNRFGYHDATLLTQIEQINGTWTMKDSYVDQQNERRSQVGKQADGPDPRLYVCSLQPMFDEVTVHGEKYKAAQAEFGKWYTLDPATGLDPTTFYGWPLRKYQYLDGEFAEIQQIGGANFYFIRLADIYLMYAEISKDSNPTLALEYINKVHRRAYGYDPGTPSPVDYTSLTDRTKAPLDDHLANNPLLYERWAEFFGEFKWWEDVRRFRIGPQETDFYQTVAAGRAIVWRDEHYAFPIPTAELESNTNPGMVQNPGY